MAPPPPDPPQGEAEALLRRWLELSELDRRAFIVMAREITASSSLIETSTIDLSRQFQNLAETAHAQMARVQTVIAMARSIEVDGQSVPLNEATRFIESVLVKVIDTVLSISKHAMRMIYALDDVAVKVDATEKCVAQIHNINNRTRFLALNAAIEAERAGAAGITFKVIAREIRELAAATNITARNIDSGIGAVASGVRDSHDVLRSIATVDMSEHILAKERLDSLLSGLIAQNNSFTALLDDAAGASEDLSSTIAPLIMGLQFQDRTTQLLAHVTEALGVLGQATESLQSDTHDALPGVFGNGDLDPKWLGRMVENQTLETTRKRFLAQLVCDAPADEDHAAAAVDIELF